MTRTLFAVAFLGGVSLAQTPPNAAPVLVELFTSEGCSSCPPADVLLEKLDRLQPISDARLIVLSEHVDYWDHLGWRDPYSSAEATARQERYARLFATEGPYTPQMVVDGAAQFVGSDAREADAAIRKAAQHDKVGVRLFPEKGRVRVEVDPLPGGKGKKCGVYVAIAQDSGTSNVARGENKGRTLHHVAIVKQLREVGTVSGREGFLGEVAAEAGSRVIAFVQEDGGRVWGAALAKLY
jgi:hypothetical protein